MISRSLAALVPALAATAVLAAAGPLPVEFDYDPAIPTPASVLGHEVGEWHVRHDRLVRYMERLAEASERLTLEVQGTTHEGRPLVLLTATAPANHRRLEQIREAHRALADPARPQPSDEQLAGLPVTVWLGYSVHGNEASGSNAALHVAYFLAAARGPEVDALLEETVVLLDPALNPDGLDRFATWVNMHRGRVAVADPAHREHREVWPGGRTNHYWFDLNRDWLLLVQPETRARVRTLRRWRPLLLGDYHEMGSSATYFFQPGVPSRINPLVPPGNLELTRKIAQHHRRALDAAGRLYYSEETFDDFYPGKGSTYPDLWGSIGVLFEPAGARGQVQQTPNGKLTFAMAIDNQFRTSLSMLRAAREHRRELFEYRRAFFAGARTAAAADEVRAWVFAVPGDPARAAGLVELLLAHGIRVHELARAIETGGRRFEPGGAFVVPVEQEQYRLLRALFERRTEFADTTFYDVSAWTLPLAFGARDAALRGRAWDPRLLGKPVESAAPPPGTLSGPVERAYAYVFDWDPEDAPRALYRLLDAELRVRAARQPFELTVGSASRAFRHGAIVGPVGILEPERVYRLHQLVAELVAQEGVDVTVATTGLTPSGIDLGSPGLLPLARPRPLLVAGRGVSGYEAGEVWHLLDRRYGIELSMVEPDRLRRTPLDRYTHLLLVDGTYASLDDKTVASIGRWVEAGGTVVATRRAAVWAGKHLLAAAPPEREAETPEAPEEPEPDTEPVPGPGPAGAAAPDRPAPLGVYADFERERDAQRISGAIFEVQIDGTHPLAWGYREPRLAVFRSGVHRLEPGPDPFETVAVYTGAPRLAGYASAENLERLAGSPAVIATRRQRGVVIRIADNPNFRGFWRGTERLYLNALFFGPLVKSTKLRDPRD